jgi:capsule polysaccharide export protein KpsE/RkpR
MALHLQDSKAYPKPRGQPYVNDLSDGDEDIVVKEYEYVQQEERSSVIRSVGDDNNTSKLQMRYDRLQETVRQVQSTIASSNCYHKDVQSGVSKLQAEIEALGRELPKKSSRHVNGGGRRQRHRSTSIAYEALAFE